MNCFKLIFNFSYSSAYEKELINKNLELKKSEYDNFNVNNIITHINMANSYITHFLCISLGAYFLFIDRLNISEFYLLVGFVEQLQYPLIGISCLYQNIISNKNLKNSIDNYELDNVIKFGKEKISFNNNSFSLGERKRIELARVIIRNSPIILLDEPTSNLDIKNKTIITNVISKLNNKTVICVSHDDDLNFTRLFDKKYIL